MNSFLSWIGGKNLLKKEIVKRFPDEYEKYIEVFGGAGWVLFHKSPSKFEVYNDINNNLTNLFKCVKYHPLELQRELSYVLNSRHLFEEMKAQLNMIGLTDIQKAARFLLITQLSYGSKGSTFGSRVRNISNISQYFELVSERLKNVIIENKGFEKIIAAYDKDSSLFYLDPPYYGSEKYYKKSFNFTINEHALLCELLKKLSGKFVLSYNDCDEVREMYKDFIIESVSRNNNLSKKSNRNNMYHEVIIRNY